MEEKERYKYYVETNQLYDSEEDELYAYNLNNNKIISILNKQDKRIKELENENQQLKQQLHDLLRWLWKRLNYNYLIILKLKILKNMKNYHW